MALFVIGSYYKLFFSFCPVYILSSQQLFSCEKDLKNYHLLAEKISKRISTGKKSEAKKFKIFSTLDSDIVAAISNSEFKECFKDFTEKREKKYCNNPCFAFIDPFGYKGIELEDIIKFCSIGQTDLILNMIYEHFNRFFTKEEESLMETQMAFLGATEEEIKTLQKEVLNKSSKERTDIITKFYMNKLRERGFYVAKIEIKKENRVKMILFYIGKNSTGFDTFKGVRDKIESVLEGNKLFLDQEEVRKREIEEFLFANYNNKEIEYNKILEVIKKHEVFTKEYLNMTLQELRKDKKIYMLKDGKKNNKNLTDTIVVFEKEQIDEQNKDRMDRNDLESNYRLF